MGSMLRNVKKQGRRWSTGSLYVQFFMKVLLTVAKIATLSFLFCFKWRKTRVTEYLYTYNYMFTMV